MTGRGGRTARSEFGYDPPKIAVRLDDQLDELGLPRKLAAGQPGWARFAPRIRILLDGQPVDRCIAFDVRKRRITCQRVDAAGRIYLDAGDLIAVEVKHGAVKVEWR